MSLSPLARILEIMFVRAESNRHRTMTELATASKPALFVLRKGILWLLSRVSDRAQTKFFPLDLSRIVIDVKSLPEVWVSGSGAHFGVWLEVSNYSPYYDFAILSTECTIFVGNQACLSVQNARLLDLPVDEINESVRLEHYLSSNDTARLSGIFKHGSVARGSLSLHMTVLTPFGPRQYTVEKDTEVKLIN